MYEIKDLPEGFEINNRYGRMGIIGNLNPGFYKKTAGEVVRYVFVDPGGILCVYRKLRSGDWSVGVYDSFGYMQNQFYTKDPPHEIK